MIPKKRPIRKPLADVDLLRFVDRVIFGEQLTTLTPHEIEEARKSQPYQMMQRVGATMYRAGEAGLRPTPALMVVEREPKAEAVPVDDEQHEPTPAQA